MATDLATLAIRIQSVEAQLAEQRLNSMAGAGARAESTMDRLGSASSSAASQLTQVAGVTLSVAGAVYAAEKAVSSWYRLISGGINIVDDFQKQIISTSYILTTMSDVKKPDLSAAYGQWTEYFKWWYEQSLDIDKRAASSQAEIFTLGIELAKKGVIVRKEAFEEDKNTIGRLTDLMKAVTPLNMDFTQQARGEVQAMLEGQVRYGAQTAQILAQIDPAFKENIKSAREQGKVLEYINSILPQIKQYTLDLMGTWDAVGASLKSAWSVINLKAFGDAHREVVALATQVSNKLVDNGRLTKEGEAAARALGLAWAEARGYIEAAFDYLINNPDKVIRNIQTIIQGIGRVAGFAVDMGLGFARFLDTVDEYVVKLGVGIAVTRASIGYLIETLTIMGRTAKDVIYGIVWDFGEIGPAAARGYAEMQSASQRWSQAAIQDANNVRFSVMSSMMTGARPEGFAFMGGEAAPGGAGTPKPAGPPPTPPVRPFTGKSEKGGGAADAEANRLMSLFDTLNKDIARLSEGTMASIDADLEKTINQIYKKIEHTVVSGAELEVLARKRASLQKQKIEEEFSVFVGKESGNNYLEIEAKAQAWLAKYKGIAGAEQNIASIKNRMIWEEEVKQYTERLGIEKSSLSNIASMMPLLSQQLPLKRKALELEIEIGKYEQERKLANLQVSDSIKDQIRGLSAFEAQMKRFNLEMENDKGLSGWAFGRAKEADQRGGIKDIMGGLESGFQNAFSSGLQGVLSKDKNTLKDIGKTMWQGLLGEMTKASVTRIFDAGAKMLRPEGPQMPGAGDNTAGQLSQAAQGLQQASTGFNLNAAQFGLAAGGLLLSGVGIMMNSQALVYAGMVLQVAGMAIQVFQTLTATTQMTAAVALTGSAAALSGAATMLMMAASADMIPFFHSGGVITAHRGWPLMSDERIIKAQVGERVLSRSQNRDYEAGYAAAGGSVEKGINQEFKGDIHLNFPNVKNLDRQTIIKEVLPVLQSELKRRGQRIG